MYLGQGVVNPPHLPFVLETVFTNDLQLIIQPLLLKGVEGCPRNLMVYAEKKDLIFHQQQYHPIKYHLQLHKKQQHLQQHLPTLHLSPQHQRHTRFFCFLFFTNHQHTPLQVLPFALCPQKSCIIHPRAHNKIWEEDGEAEGRMTYLLAVALGMQRILKGNPTRKERAHAGLRFGARGFREIRILRGIREILPQLHNFS